MSQTIIKTICQTANQTAIQTVDAIDAVEAVDAVDCQTINPGASEPANLSANASVSPANNSAACSASCPAGCPAGGPLTMTIEGGVDKSGNPDAISEIEISRGEIIGIVGPTGSGKSTLIADIEQFALGDTPSGRRILINGLAPKIEQRSDPRKKLVAQLSQNMHFLADMYVGEFLRMHAKSRGKDPELAEKVIELANTLTGEPISPDHQLTILSGGQSRALMVADIAVISDSPIVLIDEIENAGIKKQEALRLLSGEGKIVVVVTHDPMLALMASRRIVMKNGGMTKVICTNAEEQRIFKDIERVDGWLTSLRETIRQGELVAEVMA
jgi:ABC-type lipoprotein export system ATPase subunit